MRIGNLIQFASGESIRALPSAVKDYLGLNQRDDSKTEELHRIGKMVGLTERETNQALKQAESGIGKFCIRFVFLIVLVIAISAILISAGYIDIGNQAPNTTYIPGTRYGTISSRDFGRDK